MELGEILFLIAPWLLSKDLFSCTLVSTYWHSIFNPLLWKNIAVSEARHKPDHLPYLAKHIKSVQSLQWEYTEWWVLHHVTRVPAPHPQPGPIHPPHRSSLVSAPGYPGRPVYNLPTSISFPTTATLQLLQLHEATQLEALALDGPFELLPLIRTLTGSTRQLRRLTLKNTNCMRRETLDISLLLNISPCLEHVSIRTHALVSAQEQGTHAASPSPGLPIKSLDLDIRSLTGRDLIAMIAQCPQLDRISWTDYGTPGGAGGGGTLREIYPMNNKFNPVDPNTLTPSLASPPPLPLLPRLCFGDAGLMALSQFSTRLTSLDIGQASAGKIQSRTVQAFLQQCSTLIHLRVRGCIQAMDMVNTRYLLSPFFELTSSDALSRLMPWACTGLQTLSVAFSISELALPFSYTHTTNANNNIIIPSDVDTHDTVAKLQQQHHYQAWAESIVFSQLSLLTQLQTLEIKSSFMRLALGTGFELLSSLTDLKNFSMAGPNIGGGGGGGGGGGTGSTINHPLAAKPSLFNETMDTWFTLHWAHVESIQVASRDRPKGFTLPPTAALHNIPPHYPIPATPLF
ncbi:hypothetical protein BGZ74_005704 [Mortierella antarctica]|nr:hypothetical protein BGZ74_005704 [Mortierella antarctica]